MFFFDPNPTIAKNAWASSTCLLYGGVEEGESEKEGVEGGKGVEGILKKQ
jgi:hypothetical protein